MKAVSLKNIEYRPLGFHDLINLVFWSGPVWYAFIVYDNDTVQRCIYAKLGDEETIPAAGKCLCLIFIFI